MKSPSEDIIFPWFELWFCSTVWKSEPESIKKQESVNTNAEGLRR